MAGNYGKYIDRMPIICTAGKVFDDPLKMDTVAKTFKEYTVDETIDTLKSNAGIAKEQFTEPLTKPPIDNRNHYLTNTEISGILNPGVRTKYQILLGDLEETIHQSYWNKEVGKVPDPTAGLPVGMDPEAVRFGKKNERSLTAREVVNPSKGFYEVLTESQIGHDMYVKTHGDYNPGEKTKKNYLSPPYDPNKRFGRRYNYDYRGIWVKCACSWHIQKPYMHCSKNISKFLKLRESILGKPHEPDQHINKVPKNHSFGKVTNRPMYGTRELIKGPDYQPCMFQRDMHKWLEMLNRLRIVTKRRVNKGYLVMNDFYKSLRFYDNDKSGFMHKNEVYKLCERNHILFSMDDMEELFKLLGLMKDDMIDYKKFVDLVNPDVKPPEMVPVKDVPGEHLYYLTMSQEMSIDSKVVDNSKLPTAGIPSFRSDLERPLKTAGIHRCDMDSLPNFTRVKTLINPSIYTRWGLSYRDFLLPRKPEVMRKLFTKVGYKLTDEQFNCIWKEGVAHDETGLCCVDTFKKLLDKYFPQTGGYESDETDCRDLFPGV